MKHAHGVLRLSMNRYAGFCMLALAWCLCMGVSALTHAAPADAPETAYTQAVKSADNDKPDSNKASLDNKTNLGDAAGSNNSVNSQEANQKSEHNLNNSHLNKSHSSNSHLSNSYLNNDRLNNSHLNNNPNSGHAQGDNLSDSQKKVKLALEQALNSDAYGKKEKVSSWKPKKKKKQKVKAGGSGEGLENLGVFLATVFEWLFWAGLFFLVVYLLSRFDDWSKWFGALQRFAPKPKPARPTELFGLDVTAQSLPEDLLARIRQYIHDKDYRKAVALLYRAALVRLIHDHGLDIPHAATEGECMALVNAKRPRSEAQAFASITQLWLHVAYAKGVPTMQAFEDVLIGFERHFYEASKAFEPLGQAG